MSWANPTIPATIGTWASKTSVEGLVDQRTGAPIAGTPVYPSVDVLVYGATWQGVVAAITAKRQGKTYLLLSDRDDLGGMMTAGIQLTDAFSYPSFTRATIPKDSLTNELFARLATRYSKNQQAMFRDQSYSSESKGTLAEINALMTKYGISYTPNSYLQSITMASGKIDTATFNTVGTYRASVFIDATYTSDLYALTGGDYYLGGEASATYSESAQFAGWSITASQPASNVDPYVTPGNSASGTIKYVNATALPAAGTAVPGLVQAMGYRLSLTQTPGQKVAFPAPDNYVASDYELHRRWFTANGSGLTLLTQVMNLQTTFGVINSTTSSAKYDANTSGFISLDFPDVALSSEYATPGTTRARKLQIESIIKQYTLGYLYFLMNDSSVPAALRTNVATYGLCSDDYAATGGFPPRAYPREGIRAVGDAAPVKSTDIAALNASTEPVAFANYAYDAHIRQYRISPTGGDHVIQEGLTPASVVQATAMSRIDRKILYPKKAQVSNLLLTWGGNMTRMAYCSIRVEPIMGVLAESAGIIASVAATQGIAVQDVNYAVDVAPKLPLFGQNLAGAVVMSSDGTWNTGGASAGTVALSGFALVASTNSPYGVPQIATCSLTSGTNFVDFTPNIATAGNFDVQVKYIDNSAVAARATVTATVTANSVPQTSSTINETYTTNNCGDWMSIGTFAFATGTVNKVRFAHDNTANPSNIVAVRFVPA